MENQNFTFSISSDDLSNIGINNFPQFFQVSKQILTNAIANLAVIDNEHLQGEENRQTQITHLQQLQLFLKLLEQHENKL